ncbi:MAG TPA: hypothetical protein VMI73_18260 [Trebonia sp.]|nr:hypothetical protein [Trebonia sp.]
MFAALADDLAGPAAAGMTVCELEELIDEESRKAVRQLLQDHYDLRALREEQQARKHSVPVAGTDGITRARLEAGHGRLLATLFGTVTVTRCAWRKPGAPDYLPADAALSLPAGRHSHTLAKLATLEAARGSFEAARDAIARRCGPVIGKRQAGDSVVRSAADIPAFYATRIPGIPPPRTGWRSRPSPCWPAAATGPPPRSPPKPTRPAWKAAGAPVPTRASATWEASASSYATTRPWTPAGRSRPE